MKGWSCWVKASKKGSLDNTTVLSQRLEAGSARPRCWQGWFLLTLQSIYSTFLPRVWGLIDNL